MFRGTLRSRRLRRQALNECADLLSPPIWWVDVDMVIRSVDRYEARIGQTLWEIARGVDGSVHLKDRNHDFLIGTSNEAEVGFDKGMK